MNLISSNNFPIKTSFESLGNNVFKVSVFPLNAGFGHTLGNSIRRVLLSSIPGFAVTKIKINHFTHEYQAVEGIKEDLQEVMLNLKDLIIKVDTSDEVVNLTIKTNKEGDITAKEFAKVAGVTVVNPELHICTINGKIDLEITVEVKKGYGFYQVTESELSSTTSLTDLLVDAHYSPITNVALDVDDYRVGSNTDFDKIDLIYTTDGSIDPKFAIEYALELVVDQYTKTLNAFRSVDDVVTVVTEDKADNKEDKKTKATNKKTSVSISEPVEAIGLTKVTTKLLVDASIDDVDAIKKNSDVVKKIILDIKSKNDKEILNEILK
jgi:DNA-directed RNA polymerase subunit alpha